MKKTKTKTKRRAKYEETELKLETYTASVEKVERTTVVVQAYSQWHAENLAKEGEGTVIHFSTKEKANVVQGAPQCDECDEENESNGQ